MKIALVVMNVILFLYSAWEVGKYYERKKYANMMLSIGFSLLFLLFLFGITIEIKLFNVSNYIELKE